MVTVPLPCLLHQTHTTPKCATIDRIILRDLPAIMTHTMQRLWYPLPITTRIIIISITNSHLVLKSTTSAPRLKRLHLQSNLLRHRHQKKTIPNLSASSKNLL